MQGHSLSHTYILHYGKRISQKSQGREDTIRVTVDAQSVCKYFPNSAPFASFHVNLPLVSGFLTLQITQVTVPICVTYLSLSALLIAHAKR